MKKMLILCLPLLLLFACQKDNEPVINPVEEMTFQGTASLPDGTKMDCELFDQMYFSKTLDFTSMGFLHSGQVTFNDNGSCSGDSTFMSWAYFEVEGDAVCNTITVKFRGDNDEIIPSVITFTKFDLDYVQGVRLDNGDVYYFYPR
jgi:hypothetical protein